MSEKYHASFFPPGLLVVRIYDVLAFFRSVSCYVSFLIAVHSSRIILFSFLSL